MITILQTQAGVDADTFAARVEAFRQAKLAHRFTVNVPAPTEHPLVEACVQRVPQGPDKPDEFVTEYHFVDNTPKLEGADA